MSEDKGKVRAATDVSSRREIQGIIAIIVISVTTSVLGIGAIAAVIRGTDPSLFVVALTGLGSSIVAFYFGLKAKATAASK